MTSRCRPSTPICLRFRCNGGPHPAPVDSIETIPSGDGSQSQYHDGPRDVIIVKVGKFNVDVGTIPGWNNLTFDVEIIDIRTATDEEWSSPKLWLGTV